MDAHLINTYWLIVALTKPYGSKREKWSHELSKQEEKDMGE